MTQQRSVHLHGSGHLVERQRAVIASLPEHWRLGDADTATARYVVGTDALQVGYDGISTLVIGEPARLDVSKVENLIASSGAIRIVAALDCAPRLLANASVTSAPKRWSLIESTAIVATGHDLPGAMLEQLAALQVLAGPVVSCAIIDRSDRHYSARVERIGGSAMISGVVVQSGAAEFTFDAISPEVRLEVKIVPGPIASPASVRLWSRDGCTETWPLHQSGYRLIWEGLADPQGPYAACLIFFADIAPDMALAKRFLG